MPPKRLKVKRGSVTVNVYPTPTGDHMAWTVSYHFAGKRKRIKKSKKSDALSIAEEIAENLNNANASGLKVDEADAASFARAKEILSTTGKPIELAVAEYVEATAILEEVPLLEAVRHYKQMHPRGLTARKVIEVVNEMLKVKEQDGLSKVWVRDLRQMLRKFSEAFDVNILNLQGPSIDAWIRSLNTSARTRKNYRTSLLTLTSFAKQRGYLPRQWHQLDAVSDPKILTGKIEIFTPQELQQLLQGSPIKFRPFLAIAAFAGVRSAEICRMTWSDVNWDKNHLTLRSSITKTGRKRQPPILPNLRQWLRPHYQDHGPICPWKNYVNVLTRIAKDVGIRWRQNALRHSYISYRVAQTSNEAQVALEAGNSVSMIHQNYLELVTRSDADAWFGIVPNDAEQDILKLKFR